MPIPTPGTKDGKADIGICMRFLRRENPEMEQDQRIRICMDKWRKSKGKPPYKGD